MNPHKSDYYIIWGLVFFWQLVYLASMLYHTGGRLSLPLDDAFIYFQYARQAAAGHFLQYNIGDMPTAGATSLLYMLLLVPGFVLGLDGMTVAVYALALGCGLLGLSAHLVLALGGALAGSFGGRVSVLLSCCVAHCSGATPAAWKLVCSALPFCCPSICTSAATPALLGRRR